MNSISFYIILQKVQGDPFYKPGVEFHSNTLWDVKRAASIAGISGRNVTLVSWFSKNNGDGVVGRAYLGSLYRRNGNNIHVVEEIRSKRGTAYVSSN